jgi:uncharacterized protein with LGFP repeats
MKMNVDIKLNLHFKEANEKIAEAAKLAMRDVVVDSHQDAMDGSPKKTGHNMRSLAGEVSGMGVVEKGEDATVERVVDDSKIQGAVYSTSGYGGYLETGTALMVARPYVYPAVTKNFTPEKFEKQLKEHLK